MDAKATGGAAFPTTEGCKGFNDGMTRRQWLAGLAMQGLLASDIEPFESGEQIAAWAWEHADAILTAEAFEQDEQEDVDE